MGFFIVPPPDFHQDLGFSPVDFHLSLRICLGDDDTIKFAESYRRTSLMTQVVGEMGRRRQILFNLSEFKRKSDNGYWRLLRRELRFPWTV